jgi:hypothetical protein
VNLVQVDAFLHRDRNLVLVVGLKARFVDAKGIGSRDEAGKNERPVRFRGEFMDRVRQVVDQLDCSSRHDRVSRIHHGARNLSRDTLGVCGRQHGQQQKQYARKR